MSSLEELLDTQRKRPISATIYGPAGVGKTSLAALFPNPIFIRAEDGLASVGDTVPAFPVADKFQDLLDQVRAVGDREHDFKTLVIDSITKASRMVETELMRDEGKDNLAACRGGYGAGYQYCAERLGQLKFLCDKLSQHRDMHIVFIAHEGEEQITPPDSEPYSRWTLRMNKRYLAPFTDDVDLCAHLRINTLIHGTGDKKRAKSDGTRIIQLTSGPATVAKNRFGISDDVVFEPGANPLLSLIPQLQE